MPVILNAPQVNSQTPQEINLSISARSNPKADYELRVSIFDYPITSLPTDSDDYIRPAQPDARVWDYSQQFRQIGSYQVSAAAGTAATFTAASGVHAHGPGTTRRTVKIKFNQDPAEYTCRFQSNAKVDLITIIIEAYQNGNRQQHRLQPWNLWRTAGMASNATPSVITYVTLHPMDGYHTTARDYWRAVAQGNNHIITSCHTLEAVIRHLSTHCDNFTSIQRVNIVAHGGYDNDAGHVGTQNHPFRAFENKLQAYRTVQTPYIVYGVFLRVNRYQVKYSVTVSGTATNPAQNGYSLTIPKDHAGHDFTLDDHPLGGSNTQYDNPHNGDPNLLETVTRNNSTRTLHIKPKAGQTGNTEVTLAFTINYPVGSKFILDGVANHAAYEALTDDFTVPGWTVYYQQGNTRKGMQCSDSTTMSKSLFDLDPLHEASRALQAKADKFTAAEFFFSSCRIGLDSTLIDTLQSLLIPSAATYGALHRIGYIPELGGDKLFQWLAGVQTPGNNNQPYFTESVGSTTRVAQPNPADSDHFYTT